MFYYNYLAMSNAADVTGKPISGVHAINSLVALFLGPNCWGTGLPYGLHIRRTGHNPPIGPSAGWWVVKTANTAGTNGLTCLPKYGGVRDNIFWAPIQ
jgi:hypothetical protein